MKYYHATKSIFKPGDHILPNFPFRNFQRSVDAVYLTTSEIPHYTILEKGIEENWDVYEVKPIGKTTHLDCWDEVLTSQPVVVVKRVGTARGLSRNGKRSSGVVPIIRGHKQDFGFRSKIFRARFDMSRPDPN